MFFTSKTQSAGFTDVWFGWELKGLCPLEGSITVGEAIQQAARFIRPLYTPEIDVAYELSALSRYVGDLGPSLSLRARVSHHNSAIALAKAQEVAKGLGAGLAMMERLHWVPMDEVRYKVLFEGLASGSIWEISRRTELVEYPAGNYTPASGRHALSIYPFPPAPNPFSRILHILNGCKEQVRLSVAIAPARFSAGELKFINAQRQALTLNAAKEADLPDNTSASMPVMGNLGLSALRGGSVFLLRIYAASVEPLPAIVANSFCSALSAPPNAEDPASDFKIRLLADEASKRLAEDNLEHLRLSLTPFQASAIYGRLSNIVTALEAAAVFRFPGTLCPGQERVRRPAPFTGRPTAEGTLIGHASNIASEHIEVRLSHESRLRHLVVAGQTGVGKTSLLLSLIIQDIAAGQGVAVLDPHGQLYSRVLENIPPERLKDVVTFDCSAEDPGHINMLEHNSVSERDTIVDHFLDIFGQLFNLELTGGPIFSTYFRVAMTLVLSNTQPKPKLEDFIRFFYDKPYRLQCVERCKDKFVTESWLMLASATGETALSAIAPYVTSKLGGFLFSQRIRKIVSCQESTVDFRSIIRERKILLVNLAKGTVGKPAASFLGMVFIEKLLRSAMHPANLARREKNFYMYADEYQNLATPASIEILAESRKFNFGAVLAFQQFGTLPPSVLKSVTAVGNIICMRVGASDAHLLEDCFLSAFSKTDLLGLAIGVGAASILSATGDKPTPFTLATSNGLALTSGAHAAKKEKPGSDGRPAIRSEKTSRRSRGVLRPIDAIPKPEER